MKRIVILQPSYLPWLGYFDQLYNSDIFVIYDDVQYDKHGWRNRNRIKAQDHPIWLTVPVLTKHQNKPLNNQVRIDDRVNWQRKHLNSLTTYYGKAPYFNEIFTNLEKVLLEDHEFLIELDMELLAGINKYLGLDKEIIRSSSLAIEGEKTDRIIKICNMLEATHYLTGDSAKDYLVTEEFEKNNIKLEFHEYRHPKYEQLNSEEFMPFLSIVDLIFNEGNKSLAILSNQGQ